MFQALTLRAIVLVLLGLLTATVARAGIFVNGDMTQERSVKPGETYRGAIVLCNTDDRPAEAKVYQTDYTFDANGTNLYGDPGKSPRSNARWIGLSREVVAIPAQGTERIDYEIKVPAGKGANLSGTYWSMIMVEPITQGSVESGELPDRTTRVTQIMRYGIQIVTHIGKSGAGNLVFANPQLLKEDGKRYFAIDVTNTGQRWLIPRLWLELYNESGNPVGKFQGEATRLYPGTSSRFKIDLGKTPNGQYLGMVAADGTGDNLFGANVELEVK